MAVGVPPIHQIVNALPVFSSTHNGRLIIYYLLAVAVLAAFAFDDLLDADRPPTRRWAVRIAVCWRACRSCGWRSGRPGLDDVARRWRPRGASSSRRSTPT